MGLFSFIKSAGAKVASMVGIGGGEEAAEISDADFAVDLVTAIRDKGVEIEDLGIVFSDGTATITGISTSTVWVRSMTRSRSRSPSLRASTGRS
jgi:hypothetical protein